MPFKHKLAHRLARLKNLRLGSPLLALSLGIVAGCEKSIVSSSPSARLVVSPSTIVLQPNQLQDFTAVGFTAAGDTADVAVTWTATGGVVDTSSSGGRHYGHYHNTQCGQFRLRATASPGSMSDSAAITVACTAPVASVTVTPAVASVPVGRTAQLRANLVDAYGNVLTGRAVGWSTSDATVATVSGSGLVTGVAAGSATITATSEGQSGSATITVTAANPAGSQFGHVFLVMEENTDYASVIGNASMPYLNGLAQQYGLATAYYANTHPSIGNYFELATGQIITNDDSYSLIVDVDNVVRELLAAGKTWKSYAESIPNACYLGGDTGNYARKHNVLALLSDVANDPTGQACNIVPFTQFATDLASGTLPTFSNIAPDLCNDAHDCSLATADAWLQSNIDPLIKSATFQQDGLLIITFDESSGDNTNGGGQVVWIAVSAKSKPGYQSTTLYQHQSTLRLILHALGITVFPGDAATAPAMDEFFTP